MLAHSDERVQGAPFGLPRPGTGAPPTPGFWLESGLALGAGFSPGFDGGAPGFCVWPLGAGDSSGSDSIATASVFVVSSMWAGAVEAGASIGTAASVALVVLFSAALFR